MKCFIHTNEKEINKKEYFTPVNRNARFDFNRKWRKSASEFPLNSMKTFDLMEKIASIIIAE